MEPFSSRPQMECNSDDWAVGQKRLVKIWCSDDPTSRLKSIGVYQAGRHEPGRFLWAYLPKSHSSSVVSTESIEASSHQHIQHHHQNWTRDTQLPNKEHHICTCLRACPPLPASLTECTVPASGIDSAPAPSLESQSAALFKMMPQPVYIQYGVVLVRHGWCG